MYYRRVNVFDAAHVCTAYDAYRATSCPPTRAHRQNIITATAGLLLLPYNSGWKARAQPYAHRRRVFRRLCVPQAQGCVASLISTAVLIHPQTKTPITMANIKVINEEGSIKCLRFGDDTRPLCHVSGQLGHLCQPCGREDQAAHILFESGTPQARREILRHEHNNLRLANIFTTMEYEAEMKTTEAWHIVVAAKTPERDALLRHWD